MKEIDNYWIYLSGLVLIGAVLRLYHLDFNSLWLDEAGTYHFAQLSFNEYWQILISANDFHPPLFYTIEKIGLIFGNSEYALRIIPAIFGVATIPVFYLIGKILFCRPIGLIMAGLITFSALHIAYSQEARMYSMLLFLISLALLFFFDAIDSNSQKSWMLFGFVSAVALWVHFYAFIFVIILYFIGIFIVIQDRKDIKNIGCSGVLFIVLSSPLFLIARPILNAHISGNSPSWGVIGIDYVGDLFITFFANYPEGLLFLLFLFTLGMVNIFLIKRRLFFILSIILSLNVIIAIILSFSIPIVGRYLLILLPLIYAGIAAVYYSLDQKMNSRVVSVVILVFLLINIPLLGFYYTNPTKDNWRAATSDLQSWLKNDDTVVVMPSYNKIPFEYYYIANNKVQYLSSLDELITLNKNYFNLSRDTHFYAVISPFDLMAVDPNKTILLWLGNHGVKRAEYKGVQIWNISPSFSDDGIST